MCRTTFWSPISNWNTGLHWIHIQDSSLSSHEILSTHTERMCRQTRQHMCTLHLWYGPTLSFQKIYCVNFTYYFLWWLWETAGKSRVVVLFNWCKWYEVNLKEGFAGLFFFMWIQSRWRSWVLHAWFCYLNPKASPSLCNCNMTNPPCVQNDLYEFMNVGLVYSEIIFRFVLYLCFAI